MLAPSFGKDKIFTRICCSQMRNDGIDNGARKVGSTMFRPITGWGQEAFVTRLAREYLGVVCLGND